MTNGQGAGYPGARVDVWDEAGGGAGHAVTNADGEKCERCWRWEPTVGSHDEHATLCTRCVEAVSQATGLA